ncbi:hypothetical protein [Stenotrophomonas sp. SORGH_AS_0321]|uniref:hypothetical protein n=1 Tax=Stenotrophomonas sp. SORGH_AS_0321 TaxID=3041787 RepID=UPI00286A5359|nr:hypothetical protein [Stenotrophomonas sp. SORGH_AS_0321]
MDVNWDALSAIGTVGAVVVSLGLARGQGRKDRKAERSRGRWIALELRQILAAWRVRVVRAKSASGPDLYFLLDDNEYRDPTVVPKELLALYDQLHHLGDDAAPIADAVWMARQLALVPVRDALRGDIFPQEEADEIENEFREKLEGLRKYLRMSEINMSSITGLAGPDRERHVFGDPI